MSKVLLIDDDPKIIETYKLEFKLSNFDVLEAADGEEGLDKAKTEKPDVILLDLYMPRKDGIVTLTELKKDPQTKTIPVVILTNFATDTNIEKAFALGAVDFVPKYRFTPQETVAKAKEALKTASLRQESV